MNRFIQLTMLAVSAVIAGCGGEVKVVTPPPPAETGFTLTVLSDAGDESVAQQLGWTAGIPGAQVTLTDSAGGSTQQFSTSASGKVAIPSLAAGIHIVNVKRLFSAPDLAKLGSGSDAVAFIGKGVIQSSPTLSSATVRVPASRKRGVLISEWSFDAKYALGLGTYLTGGFLELYNNSDTTVFLDGMVMAKAFDVASNYPNFPCSMFETLRNDPAGIWAIFMEAFPGTGRQYPVAPGQIKVVATDAIDHSPFSSGLLDLRNADFEFTGEADVDNPGVPNMIPVGTEGALGGHGLDFYGPNAGVTVLSAPFDRDAAPRQKDPRNARIYIRVPRERILDVFAAKLSVILSYPWCSEVVHRNFEREEGAFLSPDNSKNYLSSFSRMTLGTGPGGREILQSTRTSAVDFAPSEKTPGKLR